MKINQHPETKKGNRINRAARLRRVSAKTLESAQEMASAIANVAPILSGHHPEARDRRYRTRLHKTLTRAALEDAATRSHDSQDGLSLYGISSSDPEALPKLRILLEQFSLALHTMKAANACVRNNDREGLRKLHISAKEIERLLQPDFTGHRGYSPVLVANMKTDIEQTSRRINELENARYRSAPPCVQPTAIQTAIAAAVIAA